MKRVVSTLGLAGVVSLALGSGVAEANTNTHGANWHAYNASQVADIDYLSEGVRNINASSRTVIGSIGFHPPPDWAGGAATFWVDGSNAAGKSTAITLAAFNWNGVVQSTVSTTQTAATYDVPLTLTNLTTFSYINGIVTLPSFGGGQTVFRGVAVVQ